MGIRYYKFPKDKKIQQLWKRMVSRERVRNFVITANTRVCSQHFVDGVKSDNSPIPTSFPWNKSKAKSLSLSPVTVLSTLQQFKTIPRAAVIDVQTSPVIDVQTSPVNDVQTSPVIVNDVQTIGSQEMLSPVPRQSVEVYFDKAVQTEGNGLFVHALLDYIERLESKKYFTSISVDKPDFLY